MLRAGHLASPRTAQWPLIIAVRSPPVLQSCTDSLLPVRRGAGCRHGIPFATDDAGPSHRFAQEIPCPTILLVGKRNGMTLRLAKQKADDGKIL